MHIWSYPTQGVVNNWNHTWDKQWSHKANEPGTHKTRAAGAQTGVCVSITLTNFFIFLHKALNTKDKQVDVQAHRKFFYKIFLSNAKNRHNDPTSWTQITNKAAQHNIYRKHTATLGNTKEDSDRPSKDCAESGGDLHGYEQEISNAVDNKVPQVPDHKLVV